MSMKMMRQNMIKNKAQKQHSNNNSNGKQKEKEKEKEKNTKQNKRAMEICSTLAAYG